MTVHTHMYVCVYKHTHPSPTITMTVCLKVSEAPKYTENYLGNNVNQPNNTDSNDNYKGQTSWCSITQ